MRRWGTGVLLVVTTSCAGSPVEATPSGGDGTSAGETRAEEASTTVPDDPGSTSSRTTDADGSEASTTSTLTSTSEPEPDSDSDSSASESSTGMVVVGCDALALIDDPPAVCSMSGPSATFRIVNDCETETLQVFWVNGTCLEVDYGVIPPGQDGQINSYETHPWRIRATSDGRLMVEVPPLEGDTTLVVP